MSHAAVGDGRPESLQSYAERRIKTVIASGAFPPGSRLSPNVLAAEFGLSHIPIREALASLAAAGYVDHTPGRGYVTRQLSSADLADINQWRQVLEREAYLLAVPELTEEDIAEMRRLAGLMSRRTAHADRLEDLRLDREFHFVAFRRAGSQQLLRLLNYLWDAAAPYAGAGTADSDASHAGHLAVLPAFAARDAQAVIAAMDAHRGIRAQHVARWEAAGQEPGPPAPPGPQAAARSPPASTRPPATPHPMTTPPAPHNRQRRQLAHPGTPDAPFAATGTIAPAVKARAARLLHHGLAMQGMRFYSTTLTNA